MQESEENEFRKTSSPTGADTDAEIKQKTTEEVQKRNIGREDDFDHIIVNTEDDLDEDELFASLNASLMRQVAEEMDAENASESEADGNGAESTMKKKGKVKKPLMIVGSVFLVLVILMAFIVGTKPGRRFVYWLAGKYIHGAVQNGEKDPEEDYLNEIPTGEPTPGIDEPDVTPIVIPVDHSVRSEEYVKNFLIFGIEQIDGANNTDTMMIATINTRDKTIKLTSILRDMYVELSDGKGRKLNSVYARGRRDGQGPELLMATIEKYYKIDLEGYAYVNFESFEKIVDLLGGVTIELGATEAKYLNTTNYISNPAYRNVSAGVNRLNGNQVVGYCRVRKVVTLGGANNDYGRTVRQRRVLEAIFNEYKSKNIWDLMSITTKCLSYITTDLSSDQISELLELVVENGITTMESSRIPIDNSFYDSGKSGYNGVTYGLVVSDPGANIKYLFQYLYGDTEEEANANYDLLD